MEEELTGNYPIIINNENVGELNISKAGAFWRFSAKCRYSDEMIRLFVYGGGAEGYLGLMEPCEGQLKLEKKLSRSAMTTFPKHISHAGRRGESPPAPEKIAEELEAAEEIISEPSVEAEAEVAAVPIEQPSAEASAEVIAAPIEQPSAEASAEVIAAPVEQPSAEAEAEVEAAPIEQPSAEAEAKAEVAERAVELDGLSAKIEVPPPPEHKKCGRYDSSAPPLAASPPENPRFTHPEPQFDWMPCPCPCSLFTGLEDKNLSRNINGALVTGLDGLVLLAVPEAILELHPETAFLPFFETQSILGTNYKICKIKNGKSFY